MKLSYDEKYYDEVFFNRSEWAYELNCQVENQTIWMQFGCVNFDRDEDLVTNYWWNVALSIYNKSKDMYTNMDKKVITGKNPFATFATAREMFYNVEASLLDHELVNGSFDEITIFCTWVDNRRRDAYYKVLSRMGYDWGTVGKEKCIMKTYRKEDCYGEILDNY